MLIVAARGAPYVARWRIAYCERLTRRVTGDDEFRHLIFLGASYINKNTARRHTRAEKEEEGGAL